jgi:hypothetical protein
MSKEQDMSYRLIMRDYEQGSARFQILLLGSFDECVDRANLDWRDCLIQDESGQPIDYRICGQWKS